MNQVAILFIICYVTIFTVNSLRFITMSTKGVKLGRSVIDVTIPQTQEQTTGEFFQRVSVGSGIDDRTTHQIKDAEDDYEVLSNLNKSFQQKKLLMTLQSAHYGEVNKLKRIELASALEDILPASTIFSSKVVQSSKLNAGGLMKDWEF